MASPPSLRAALLSAALLAACHTGSANTMAGAATITTLAVGAAAANRAAGGCIAICTAGTACNTKTGLCEPLPCRGQCGPSEHCEENFTGSKCVPGGGTSGVETAAPAAQVKIPWAAPAIPPEDSSSPPKVVPKAEQQPPRGEGK